MAIITCPKCGKKISDKPVKCAFCGYKLVKTDAEKNSESTSYVFTFVWLNYILIGAGLLILALGYILLSGGGSDDPNVFNMEMFNSRRMVVAPLFIVLGLVVEICAIMIRPKDKAKQVENNDQQTLVDQK